MSSQLHLQKRGFCWLNTHLCRGAGMPFARGLAFSHPFSLSKGKAQGDLMAQKQGCLPAAGQPQSRLKKATSPKDDLCDCPVAGRVC